MDSKLRRTNQEHKNRVSVGMRDYTYLAATKKSATFEQMNLSMTVRQWKGHFSIQKREENSSNMEA
jgi:hypothetical protein